MPEETTLRSIETLLRDAHRLMQNQLDYFSKERAGGTLAAALTPEELQAVSLIVRTLRTIHDKAGDAGGEEDISKVSDEELEKRAKRK